MQQFRIDRRRHATAVQHRIQIDNLGGGVLHLLRGDRPHPKQRGEEQQEGAHPLLNRTGGERPPADRNWPGGRAQRTGRRIEHG